MKTIWRRAPMLRLCLPFLVGMFLYIDVGNHYFWIGGLLILGIFGVGTGLHFYKSNYQQRHWLGIGILLLFVAFGALRMRAYLTVDQQLLIEDKSKTYLVQLIEKPMERENSYRCRAEIWNAAFDSTLCNNKIPILIYFGKSSQMKSLDFEDILIIHAKAQRIQKPNAPGEFDVQSHYVKKGITHQMFADSTHWSIPTKPNNHSIMYHMNRWRSKALAILSDYGVDGDEYSVLAALILGDTSDMDKDLMASYSAAGVVHVLAVSGLHVGLVYVLMAPIFKRIFGRSKGRWLRTILPIAILWLYSLLTGGSPSVLRAAVMFSGFIFAENFGKNNNIYNTLSASAFVLLMIKPSMLFELGFQLSYLAVVGIVILQKPLYLVITVKNKWLDKLWTMTAVSIAAQIVTVPLTLYYFHQFPNYFLASNLFIIPWSTLIIYVSILFYCTLPFPAIAQIICKVMVGMTNCMNRVIVWFDHLPGSVTSQIECTNFHFWCWCAALFFGLRWLFWRRTRAFLVFLSVLLVAVSYNFCSISSRLKQNVVMMHCGKKEWFISHIVADSMAVFLPSGKELKETSYGWQNYQREMGVLNHLDTLKIGNLALPFYMIQETLIYSADSAAIQKYGIPMTDVLILYDLGKLRLNKSDLNKLRCWQVVIASNISKRKMNWIKEQLHESVEVLRMVKGAYILVNRRWQPYSDELLSQTGVN